METNINSEEELCSTIMEAAKERGFGVYPETSGYDFVLRSGRIIIGVHAKLTINLDAVYQCVRHDDAHFKILLYRDKPKKEKLWKKVLLRLRVIPMQISNKEDLTAFYRIFIANLFAWRHRPKRLLYLPDFEPKVKAGVQNPSIVSRNRIKLVEMELFARSQGGKIKGLDALVLFGISKIPKGYYKYKDGFWYLRDENLASVRFPHILNGILETRNNEKHEQI